MNNKTNENRVSRILSDRRNDDEEDSFSILMIEDLFQKLSQNQNEITLIEDINAR